MKIYTITGKTDGFGSQYQAIMAGIAYCFYMKYKYIHTPIKTIRGSTKECDELNKFIGIHCEDSKNKVDINEPYPTIIHYSNKPDIYYTKEVLNYIRKCYNSTAKPNVEYPDIAIHIRRGDVKKGMNDRYTDNNIYNKIIEKLITLYPNYKISIYSEGKIEDFNDIQNNNVKIILNQSICQDFHSLVKAKILVTAKSSFSYSAALLNENTVYYIDFWHKKLNHWNHINSIL